MFLKKLNTFLKENKGPVLVGLTGGIGSGKSTVARVFRAMGVPVFQSDDRAKVLLNEDASVRQQVIAHFGKVYEQGQLNRKALADIVFNDPAKREILNNIVHPAVGNAFNDWVNANMGQPILVKEAAILIETGAYKELDHLILVTCPEEERIQRVMKRDSASEQEVSARIKSQWSDEQKMPYCDYTINTHNTHVIPQVLEILAQIKSLTS